MNDRLKLFLFSSKYLQSLHTDSDNFITLIKTGSSVLLNYQLVNYLVIQKIQSHFLPGTGARALGPLITTD